MGDSIIGNDRAHVRVVIMLDAIKEAEERYVRDLCRENSELRRKLDELRRLIAERDSLCGGEVEIIRGRQVKFK